jgi:alpha-glucosidase
MGEYDAFVHLYDLGHPDVHEAHRAFQAVLDEYAHDPMSVGEIHIFDLPEWASYYGHDFDQFSMPFNFHLMACDWNARSVRALVEAVHWNVPAGGWTNWTLGNHDEIRLASRLPEGHERLAALLLLSLRGTPFLYYGDELGMKQTSVSADEKKDPWGDNVDYLSRDGERTPMQWNSGPNAGFAAEGTKPWLPIADDYETVNVESALTKPDSTLNMYRRLLAVRRESEALRFGSFMAHPSSSDDVFVYRRESDHETVSVALNFSEERQTVQLRSGQIIFSTADPERTERFRDELSLDPGEGAIVRHR